MQLPIIKTIYKDSMIIEDLHEVARKIAILEIGEAISLWNKTSSKIENLISRVGSSNINLAKELLSVFKMCRQETSDFRVLENLISNDLIPNITKAVDSLYEPMRIEDSKRVFERTPSGFLTIMDLETGRYIHSPWDPMHEADIFSEELYSPDIDNFHILGCGLGYLPYQIWEKSEHSVQIYIYEEDIAIIEYAKQVGALSLIDEDHLTICDASDLSSMLKQFIESTESEGALAYVSDWKVGIYEDNIYGKQIDQFDYNMRTERLFRKSWAINVRENSKQDLKDVEELKKDFNYVGKDFIVVSAGPSLNDSIDYLKNNCGDKVIISINTSLRKLVKENIFPDIVVMLDPHNLRMISHIKGIEEYTYNIPIVFPTNGSQAFIARYKGPKYALYNYEMTKSGFKWNFGGTVASLGIDLAYFLEAGKIYLIGSDLAFPNNQNYAEGVAHNTTEGINNTIFTHSVDGGLVATNNVYNEYRKIIERQIAFHPDIPVYNMSRHGADISGTNNIDDIE